MSRPRRVTAGAALALAAALAAGCGTSGQSHPDPAVAKLSAQMRAETAQATRSLSRGAAQAHAGGLVQLGAAYVSCHLHSPELRYSRTIALRPAQPLSVPVLATRVVAAMRAAGWRLRSVDMASMHIPAGAAPHPLYYFSQAPTTGAANVIPYNATGAEAVVFVNSPCFNAGPQYQALQRGR